MPATLVAVALAIVLAGWSWRGRLSQPLARWAAAARAVALAALLLLFLNPPVGPRTTPRRPLVLLDNSVSMHAAAGHAAAAARLAATLGDTSSFAELAPGEPGDRSDLHDPLASASADARPVIVVTDGEVADADAIPADLLAQTTIRLLSRSASADVGIRAVTAPRQVSVGDTVRFDIDLQRTATGVDSAIVVIRDSALVLAQGTAHFAGETRAHLTLSRVWPHRVGVRWLTVSRAGAADAEPGDDVRWLAITASPSPGVVVVTTTPDWDARAIYRAMTDVAGAPVRGYVELQPGIWRRSDDLALVNSAEVMAAARAAELLVVRGDPAPWRGSGRAELIWPAATSDGDWYLAPGGASPVSDAFATVDVDSLPPATSIRPLDSTGGAAWIGATARRSRRGAAVPVVIGRVEGGRRVVTIGASGLGRWALRGGVANQVWRVLIADAAAWLLNGQGGDSASARPVTPVTLRGEPVRFRWAGSGGSHAIALQWQRATARGSDTLRFADDGLAELALPVGRYSYVAPGGRGEFAVEPFGTELLPSPATLVAHDGHGATTSPRRPLRDLLGLFALAIAAFGAEWMFRRRLGMR